MRAISAFLHRHQRAISILSGLFIILLVIARMIRAYQKAPFLDLRVMMSTCELIVNHTSPYMTEAFNALGYDAPPVQPPSMSILLLPLLPLPFTAQAIIVFGINLIAAILCLFVVIRHYRLYEGSTPFTPCYPNLLLWFLMALALMSDPAANMLRYGQWVSVAWLCMLLVLFQPKRERSNAVLLGLAAAIKYSLLPLAAPLLLLQGRWRICVIGFALFLILVLLPGLWLDGIIPGITEYLRMLAADMKGGANSYTHGITYNMIHFEFLRLPHLNLLGKALILFLVALMLLGIRKERGTGSPRRWPAEFAPAELGLLASATLCLSYHRIHDAFIMIPFLVAVCLQCFREQRFREFTVSLAFLLYMAQPTTLHYRIAGLIGSKLPFLEKFVYFGSYPFKAMFPLTNIAIYLLTVWFFVLAWKGCRQKSLSSLQSQAADSIFTT